MRKGCSRSRTFGDPGSPGSVLIDTSSPVRTLSSNVPNRTRSASLGDSSLMCRAEFPSVITSLPPSKLFICRQIGKNNHKIMVKCIYRRTAKESKSFTPDREQQRCQADEDAHAPIWSV